MVPCLTDSPFDTLEKTFDLLVAGPHPLALDGTSLDGLANRAIPLGELKAMLLHPSMSFHVLRRARRDGRRARRALARQGRRLDRRRRRGAWPLVQSCPGKAADIEAQALAAFLVAELIGVTRIGDVELADVANALGISYKACHQRHPR